MSLCDTLTDIKVNHLLDITADTKEILGSLGIILRNYVLTSWKI
jgi:hypothetical protein